MLINGLYLDFYGWVKKTSNSISISEKGGYISPLTEKELNVEHKIKFIVKNEFVADQLEELFENASFSIVANTMPLYKGFPSLILSK